MSFNLGTRYILLATIICLAGHECKPEPWDEGQLNEWVHLEHATVVTNSSFAHRELKAKLPTGPSQMHASAYMRSQRVAAKSASEVHRTEAAEQRREKALQEQRMTAAKRRAAEADIAKKRAQAEADRQSGERSRQEKRARRKGKVFELEGWEKRELKRNATLARKAMAKEQHRYEKMLHRQYLDKQAALKAKCAMRAEAASVVLAGRRAAGVEALGRQQRRVRNAANLEESLAQTAEHEHLAWVRQLTRAAHRKWGVPAISLHVVCDANRPSVMPLQRLLASLSAAHYLEDEVDLFVHVDRGPYHEPVMAEARAFDWPFGAFNATVSATRQGLLRTILGAWSPSDADEIGVLLEDDHEVSPLFYAWIKWCALTYRLDPDQRQKLENGRGGRAKIYGISLYTPRVSTTQFPQPFKPPTLSPGDRGRSSCRTGDASCEGSSVYSGINKNSETKASDSDNKETEPLPSALTPYLSQLPCGGGAFAFFGDTWQELRRYAVLRLAWASPPVQEPKEGRHGTAVSGETNAEGIEESKSEESGDTGESDDAYDEASSFVMSVGVFSRDGLPSRTNGRTWKWLFMLELAASRNYFLVYPNFPDGASLSTSHLEERRAATAASSSNSKPSKEAASSLFRVPLLQGGVPALLAGLPQGHLPDVLELPQLDVFNDRIVRGSPDVLNSGENEELEDSLGKDGESLEDTHSHSSEQLSSQAVVIWRATLSEETGGRAPQPVYSGCKTASSNAADLVLTTVKLYVEKIDSGSSNCQNFIEERSALVAEAETVDTILAANLDRDPEEALEGGASSEMIVRRVLGRVLQQTRLPDWVLVEAPPGASLSLQAHIHHSVATAGLKRAPLVQAAPQAVLELTRGVNCLPRLKLVAAAIQPPGSQVSNLQISYPELSSSSSLPALKESFLTSLQFAASQRQGTTAAGAMSIAMLPDDAPNELLCRLASATSAATLDPSDLEPLEAQYSVQHVNLAEKVNLIDAVLEPIEHSLREVCSRHFKRGSSRTPIATPGATSIASSTSQVFVADSGALVPLEVAARCLGWVE